jgi:hypothetical protein
MILKDDQARANIPANFGLTSPPQLSSTSPLLLIHSLHRHSLIGIFHFLSTRFRYKVDPSEGHFDRAADRVQAPFYYLVLYHLLYLNC